ncbi:MAG: hypothetical protein KJ624_01470 [Chloroflexi bacterium]|nr:hypothetical protein [Chloroflexota bacterium]
MKRFTVILMLLIVLVPLAGCGSSKVDTARQEKVTKGNEIAKELADKYQATTDWGENLTYTLQAQERLITGKPTLFRGDSYLDDVFNRDGITFIRFSIWDYASGFYCVLELECGRQILDKLFMQKSYGEYVVVAKIQEVTKPIFALKGSALSDDEVVINIESSGLFIVKGTCVDIAYIGE